MSSEPSLFWRMKYLAAIVVFAILVLKRQEDQMNLQPPVAKKKTYTQQIQDQKIVDDYFWLRDAKWPHKVEDKEVIEYLQAENSYAENVFFKKFKDQENALFTELKSRIKEEDKSSEIKKEHYYYYTRNLEGKDYELYCRRNGAQGAEEVMLDVNQLAEGKKYTKIGYTAISPKQDLLLYTIDHKGDESYQIKILQLAQNNYLPDSLENISGKVVWHEKLDGFFYTEINENLRPTKVFFYQFATKTPRLIFEEKNPLYILRLNKTASRKYLMIESGGAQENEIYLLDFDDPNLELALFKARQEKVLYNLEHNGDKFYIHTNDQGANFRLATTSANNYATSRWDDFVSSDKQRYLESFSITQKYLILNYIHQALPEIEIIRLNDNKKQKLQFNDSVYTASGYSTNFYEDDIRINYSSLACPQTIYQYNYDENELKILKVKEICGEFNPDEYQTERVWTQSDDVEVPVSLLYKKSLMKGDGSNPLYLYGYGSYGIAIPPVFRSNILSLVDRGFIFAIAHIRGGDDLGYHWYEEAKFLNKKRTFDDFLAVSQDLIEKKYTSEGQIAIAGGSAGGMLIGNVINQRPELYKAAVAHVPFVDVLNTMLDESLPLTPGEFKEWGNPKDPAFFQYIKSYSPYDNVNTQNYPNIFATCSLYDPRVGYFEPAKWVAKLRAHKTDNNLLLLKTDMDSGHFGASGRFDYLREVAQEYLFILKVFGIKI